MRRGIICQDAAAGKEKEGLLEGAARDGIFLLERSIRFY